MQDQDIDALWNFDDPAQTEDRFQKLIAEVDDDANTAWVIELLTQLARAQGLQRKFAEAHEALDLAQSTLKPAMHRAHIRYLLERGRVFNSSGKRAESKPLFLQAWQLGLDASEDNLAIDAAHMLGIVEDAEAALQWNEKALAHAEQSADPKARNWLASLYNNTGWTHHGLGEYERALELFQRALRFREAQGQPGPIRIAQWSVARCLRSLGRADEALTMQRTLLDELTAAGEVDGFVFEEIGECLLALDQLDDALPYLAKAHDVLSQDAWLVENEPARLKRLKELIS
jgi:tetratricopeptide (TPR) repeat protein